jgi:phage gpG-like protein
MKFEFSILQVPSIPDRMKGDGYERFKRTLLALLLSQRFQVFNDETSLEGPWAPLSGQHLVRRLGKVPAKRRDEPGAVKILQDKGVLRQSFTDAQGPGNGYRIEETQGDEVRLATSVEYARIQNDGGTINWPGTTRGFGRGITIPAHDITIPARPYDQFTDENVREINELTELYLNGEL